MKKFPTYTGYVGQWRWYNHTENYIFLVRKKWKIILWKELFIADSKGYNFCSEMNKITFPARWFHSTGLRLREKTRNTLLCSCAQIELLIKVTKMTLSKYS